jgi:hypothetical protein
MWQGSNPAAAKLVELFAHQLISRLISESVSAEQWPVGLGGFLPDPGFKKMFWEG